MNVIHMITGYDKATERLAYEFAVADADVPEMRDIAHVEPSDVEAVGSYPLNSETAHFIATRFNFPMAVERCDWFFEPYAA